MDNIKRAAKAFTPQWLKKLPGSYTSHQCKEACEESFVAGANFVLTNCKKPRSTINIGGELLVYLKDIEKLFEKN